VEERVGGSGGRRRRIARVARLARKDVLYLDRLRFLTGCLDWLVVRASSFKEAMWY
jgi:hypothetical protein